MTFTQERGGVAAVGGAGDVGGAHAAAGVLARARPPPPDRACRPQALARPGSAPAPVVPGTACVRRARSKPAPAADRPPSSASAAFSSPLSRRTIAPMFSAPAFLLRLQHLQPGRRKPCGTGSPPLTESVAACSQSSGTECRNYSGRIAFAVAPAVPCRRGTRNRCRFGERPAKSIAHARTFRHRVPELQWAYCVCCSSGSPLPERNAQPRAARQTPSEIIAYARDFRHRVPELQRTAPLQRGPRNRARGFASNQRK